MIENIEMTDSCVTRWDEFFNKNARDGVRLDATTLEMLRVVEDRLSSGETPSYELGRQYTKSGNPEIFYANASDFLVKGVFLPQYSRLTRGGTYQVELNQDEACVALKIHDYGITALRDEETEALYALISKLKDKIWP